MKYGVYRIVVDRPKGQMFYIGQAGKLSQRWRDHLWRLRRNDHENRRLQQAFNRYGEVALSFEVILICEPSALTMYEQAVVDFYPKQKLYNICLECVETRRGITLTASHRAKIAKSHTGLKASVETCGRISAGRKGWVPPASHIEHLRNLTQTPKHRARMVAWAKGPGRLAKIGKKKSAEEIVRRTATRRANAALRAAV